MQLPRFIKTIIILAVLFIALLMLAIPVFRQQDEPPADVVFSGNNPAAAWRNPFGIYSPGNLDSVPAGSRQEMIETLGVGSYTAFQDFNMGAMRDAGAGWLRLDFEFDGEGFQRDPDYVERMRASGLEVVGCIRPVKGANLTNLSSFRAGLLQLIELYPWIKVWQIGNEPNVTIADPEDYSRLYLAGSRTIQEACPGCRIALGGVASHYQGMGQAREYYRRVLTSIAAQSPGRRPFDIFDLHFYGAVGSDGMLLSTILDYRRLLEESGVGAAGLEIWMTETATYTGERQDQQAPVQTEDQQAAELVRRFVTALGAGLTRVSWARPYENYRYNSHAEDNLYDLTAIIYNGLGQEASRGIKAGAKKKSWYAYRTLVAKLQGYDEVRYLAPGVYEVDFGPGRQPLFIVWDSGAGAPPDRLLPPAARGTARVTDMTGNETRAGTASLRPDPNPVFVEPAT